MKMEDRRRGLGKSKVWRIAGDDEDKKKRRDVGRRASKDGG